MICNWGIIGPGFIANRAIIPAIQGASNSRVLAVASSNAQRARDVSRHFGIERSYTAYQLLLNDPDIDVVYIALPNHLHHEWTIRAAKARKHVLCEKPLAMNASECVSMISACDQAQVLLMEAVMYRFHPRMRYLKHMLASRQFGEVSFLHAAFSFNFNAPDNYRAFKQFGGGAILDIGSYCVNAARWLLDSEPLVTHAITSYSHSGIDVITSAVLRFNEDTMAHIQCSFISAEHQVIEVVGTVGAVTAPLAFTAWRNDTTRLFLQHGQIFEEREFEPSDPYKLMVEHFADCVLENSPLLYPAEDGLANMQVLDKLTRVKDVQ
jgi:predicted dehydrogenase